MQLCNSPTTPLRSLQSRAQCAHCRSGVRPFSADEVKRAARTLGRGWRVVADRRLDKTFSFADFADTLGFIDTVNRVYALDGHRFTVHVDRHTVTIRRDNHEAGGLADCDFILAARIEQALRTDELWQARQAVRQAYAVAA